MNITDCGNAVTSTHSIGTQCLAKEPPQSARSEGKTRKYRQRRDEIVSIASELINVHGAAGLTFADVARELSLDTSSIIYYFRKREQLAAACFARTLDLMAKSVAHAAQASTPQARVRNYLRTNFDLFIRQRPATAPRLANLSDMRALEGEARAELDEKFLAIFGQIRDFFADTSADIMANSVRAHIVMANALCLFGWLDSYLESDLSRVFDRTCDLFERGLAPTRAPWRKDVIALEADVTEADPLDRFLHAATNLINEQGYRGASVEKIAAALGVTIGSFYHHLDNKDDLVAACCERSFALFERAQTHADAIGGSAGDRLGTLIATLLAHQFNAESPLLRVAAYQALPPDLRQKMYARGNQEAMHIAGLISDGRSDGSIRDVDPYVASQVIMATLNAAVDLRIWGENFAALPSPEIYARLLVRGIFSPVET